MQTLREQRGRGALSVEVQLDIHYDRDTDLVTSVLTNARLYASIEKAGFLFDNMLANGTIGTIHELVKYLTYEGRRIHAPDFKGVKANIYNVEWLTRYVDSVLFWQSRSTKQSETPQPRCNAIPRYTASFTPWKGGALY